MKPRHPARAYNNLEFMNSPDARTLRILAEFLEPRSRFRKEGIRDTIVVFGSARVMSPFNARKKLNLLMKMVGKSKDQSRGMKLKLANAQMDLEMSNYYEDARKLSYMLTKWARSFDGQRHFVICSGGGPGIMEAANRGAIDAGGKSIGLNISLPFEQESNPYISKDLCFEFHYFFMRKFWFVYLAKALIMFPGGFGTFDELFEVLTLIQTKKVKKTMPIILYGSKYWKEVLNLDAMVKHNTISRKDLKLFRFADTPQQAFAHLKVELSRIYLDQQPATLLRSSK